MTNLWTEDRVEQLTKLWADGLSGSQIAAMLGGFGHCIDRGRSAVIGKIHRLKLPQPAGKQVVVARRAPRRCSADSGVEFNKPLPEIAAAAPVHAGDGFKTANMLRTVDRLKRPPTIPQAPKTEAPNGSGVKLLDLDELHCRWPKGDPREQDFEFCGAIAIPGMPYCAHHCRLAYQPPSPYKGRGSKQPEGSQHGKTWTTQED